MQARSGHRPVLMLDDVLSELDLKRQQALTEHVEGQVLLTTATKPPEHLKACLLYTSRKGEYPVPCGRARKEGETGGNAKRNGTQSPTQAGGSAGRNGNPGVGSVRRAGGKRPDYSGSRGGITAVSYTHLLFSTSCKASSSTLAA